MAGKLWRHPLRRSRRFGGSPNLFAGMIPDRRGQAVQQLYENRLFDWPPRTGTLSSTLADATLSASGSVGATGTNGTLAVTLDSAALSAAGVVLIRGSASLPLSSATLSAAARVLIQGGAAVALADATLNSTAQAAIRGTLGATLADAQLVANAALSIRGTLALTLADASLQSAGTVGSGAGPITGQASITLQGALLTATGVVRDVELNPVYIMLPAAARQLRLVMALRTVALEGEARIPRLAERERVLPLDEARRQRLL